MSHILVVDKLGSVAFELAKFLSGCGFLALGSKIDFSNAFWDSLSEKRPTLTALCVRRPRSQEKPSFQDLKELLGCVCPNLPLLEVDIEGRAFTFYDPRNPDEEIGYSPCHDLKARIREVLPKDWRSK